MVPYYFQFWTYNVETGETDSLFNFISGTVPLVYSWSTDNSKIVIGNLWAWGAFALGTLSIYDAYLDSLTGISEDQRFPLQNPILSSCSNNATDKTPETEMEKVSYSLGVNVATGVKAQGLDTIDANSIAKAFNLSYGYHKEAYKILETYYGAENFNKGRKKMSMLPDKALLIFNPSSGAPGFIVDNVYCLPGVPSILKSMLGGLNSKIKGGKKILTKTISLITVESEIAESLERIQNKFKDVEIGSYPFFKQGKVGVSIVMRSTKLEQIKNSAKQIQSFIKQKKIKILGKE